MSNFLVLNSSIIVKKPIFSFDNIKIEYGSNRIKSYLEGFNSLKDLKIYDYFDKVLIVDNTIKNKKKFPQSIKRLIPENAEYILDNQNVYGRINKGAGMMDSLQKNLQEFKKSQKIFYFEPRLILKDIDFCKNFIHDDKNYFSFESKERVKTGYFGSITKDLVEFVNQSSVQDIVDKSLHIELLMYQFYKNKNTAFLNSEISLWKNYLSEIYENY